SPGAAAREAIAELGDVRELLGAADAAGTPTARERAQAAFLRHHVRPKPGFVVRVVVSSLVLAAGVALGALGATGVLALPAGVVVALLGAASVGLGLVVGDSLAQETTTNHPMPPVRAGTYGIASLLALCGLGFVGLVALGSLPVWCVVFAALGVVASVILFAFLGASQTNRHKAWMRNAWPHEVGNRFEEEPETAAKFGIYTAAIWLVTFGLIVVLVFTVGWWWAPLAFVGGLALMMIVLARMMYGPRKGA
ncbi:MAG: hypothetical protein QM626_07345, partial [Microbacterium sp.]|uniref:hypothetical protein n=1 Tax=Microbacterium sp. TaxID=51671 RepID=UPI0039E29462